MEYREVGKLVKKTTQFQVARQLQAIEIDGSECIRVRGRIDLTEESIPRAEIVATVGPVRNDVGWSLHTLREFSSSGEVSRKTWSQALTGDQNWHTLAWGALSKGKKPKENEGQHDGNE